MAIRADVLSVIGGGWSFGEVDHRKVPGTVIAVNDTLLHFRSQIGYVVSMDRLWTENRWESMKARCVTAYLRRSSLKKITVGEMWLPWLHTFECDRMSTTFSNTHTQLNGRNSGACALNLAYTLRPTELYLFGFDMCRDAENKAYWYPGYEWTGKGDKGGTGQRTYEAWATDFAHYAEQFKELGTRVFNVSPSSKITAFERVSAKDIGCTP